MYKLKNNISNLKNLIYFVYLALILIIIILYFDSLLIASVCDNTSVHEFINNDTDVVSYQDEVSKTTKIYNSFKCRLSWFIDKNDSIYNTYNEYKKNWDTNTSLIDIIKADLAKSRADTLASINKKKKFDRQIWAAKWARRAEEDQRYYKRNERMFNYFKRKK